MKNIFLKAVILLSFLFYLVSMAIVKQDRNFNFVWIAFGLHYLSFFPIFALFVYEYLKNKGWRAVFKRKCIFQFLFVILVAIVSNFIFLEKYPFVSVGDELRDSGLNALRIVKGEERNIFGYGSYNGYGLDVSVISSFFSRLFGNSVLVYRFPSALLAVIEVFVIYLFGYLVFGNTLAFWSAITLIALPMQLLLARTELLVLFNSFLTAVILLLFFFLKDKKIISFATLGIVLGYSFGFHTAVRVVALIILLTIVLLELFSLRRFNIRERAMSLFVLVLFGFVGFGPRLWFTTKDIFFAKHRLYSQVNIQQNLFEKSNELGGRYYHSFLAWTTEPLQGRTVDNKPILTPFLSIFFVVGLVISLLVWDNLYLRVVSLLTLVLPFFNSALTDTLNQGHRLSPLLPVGAILVAVGIVAIQQKIPRRILRNIFSFVILFYLLSQIFFFFYNQPVSKSAGLKDYLSMHLIYFLKDHPELTKGRICLRLSPNNWQSLDLMHYREQYAYFFPKLDIERYSDPGVSDDEIFIGTGGECEQYLSLDGGQKILSSIDNLYKISCATHKAFICPLEYSGEIKIHY